MLRLIYVSIVSLPFILYYLWKASYVERHGGSYDEARRYKIARRMVSIMKRNGLIRTKVYGLENLPEEGGYVMYPNHQGKYDSLGIVWAHKKPCTIVIDEKRSHLFLTDQFITLLKGARLDKTNMKSQLQTILGRRYILFPEGGYYHNRNDVQAFLPGAFKCAMKAKSPIVPVALIDSYKPFELNTIRPVTTQVHFLKPLYYEDYKDMNSTQIAELVRTRIMDVIKEACG